MLIDTEARRDDAVSCFVNVVKCFGLNTLVRVKESSNGYRYRGIIGFLHDDMTVSLNLVDALWTHRL